MSPRVFRGIAVSPGIAIGKVQVVEVRRLRVKREPLDDARLPQELSRLKQAVEVSRRQILEIQDRIARDRAALRPDLRRAPADP